MLSLAFLHYLQHALHLLFPPYINSQCLQLLQDNKLTFSLYLPLLTSHKVGGVKYLCRREAKTAAAERKPVLPEQYNRVPLPAARSTRSLPQTGIGESGEMAAAERKEAQPGGLEWRVTVPEGSTAKVESEAAAIERAWAWMVGCMVVVRMKVVGTGKRVWRIGADDPRKVMHGLKVGVALTLVSLFYYTRPLYDGVGGAAMWAIMTVVVVFEYTVGGCLYKGFNRATATLSAGALAVGVHWIAAKSGEQVEPCLAYMCSASAATFSRFIPTVKARFDYGVTIFILTYSLVAVSGYRVEQLLALAQKRLSTIAIGVSICLLVCVLICPVWAGVELHLLTVRNMEKLADSLDSCVEDYFTKDRTADAKNTSHSPKSQGYKCVINSKAAEDSQANLARWEPAHGRFSFRHPWSQYQKVGAAMRYCAYCIEALNGCINSEIQAPESIKKHLSDVCMRVSSQCSMVLKDMSSSIKAMRRSQGIDLLVADMNEAVQELQSALKAFPNELILGTTCPQREAASEEKKHSISVTAPLPLMEALPLITAASLLIEISSRINGAVNAVETLARVANFDDPHHLGPEHSQKRQQMGIKIGDLVDWHIMLFVFVPRIVDAVVDFTS